MTEEELKDRLVKWILDNSNLNSRDAVCYSEELIALIRDAGYKSPEEVKEMNDIILFGPKSLR